MLHRQISLASQLVKLLSQLSDELQEFARKHIMDKQQALDQTSELHLREMVKQHALDPFRVQLATEHCRSLCHKLQVRDHLSSRRAAVSSALKDVKQSLQAYADLGEPFAKEQPTYIAIKEYGGSAGTS
eukprot:scaffold87182_cov18-Tisochrysis_lutea.AAC.1